MFLQPFQTRFLNVQTHRDPYANVGLLLAINNSEISVLLEKNCEKKLLLARNFADNGVSMNHLYESNHPFLFHRKLANQSASRAYSYVISTLNNGQFSSQ